MDIEEFWLLCLESCNKELTAQQYNTWLKPLTPDYDKENKILYIVAPNLFVLQWVKERFNDSLVTLTKKHLKSTQLDYKVNKKKPRQTPNTLEKIILPRLGERSKPEKNNGLNKAFTFSNFVTGKANQLATAAAVQIAENPGLAYNPLFIYGGVGLGKTHLIHAIENHLKELQPNAKIKHLHA